MPSETVTVDASDVLDACEARLLSAAVRLAPRLGWGERLIEAAAREAAVSRGEVTLLWPGGAVDLATALADRHDAAALKALGRLDLGAMRVRERIAASVEARIDAAVSDEAAVRRCLGFLALPHNVPLALRLGWTSADRLWRWAGDVATDENHYSKRALLAEILISTLLVRLARGPGASRAHLQRRIDGVMAFEGWKRRAPSPLAGLATAARTLGALRYGRGEAASGESRVTWPILRPGSAARLP